MATGRVSAAVHSVRELNIRLDKFTPILEKMSESIVQQTSLTEKMLSLQIEQTEYMRRRENYDKLKPPVSENSKGEQTPVEPKKKEKDDKSEGMLGGLGTMLSRVGIAGLVGAGVLTVLAKPLIGFMNDFLNGAVDELWKNVADNMPEWMKQIVDNTPKPWLENGAGAGLNIGIGAAIGTAVGAMFKAVTFGKIKGLVRGGGVLGIMTGLFQSLGMDFWEAVGSAIGIGALWKVRKWVRNATGKGATPKTPNPETNNSGRKAPGSPKEAPKPDVPGQQKRSIWKRIGDVFKNIGGGAKGAGRMGVKGLGRLLGRSLGFGAYLFGKGLSAMEGEKGNGELTDEQRRYMESGAMQEQSAAFPSVGNWIEHHNRVYDTPPNLFDYFKQKIKSDRLNAGDEPLGEKELNTRAYSMAKEALPNHPGAVITVPEIMKDVRPKPEVESVTPQGAAPTSNDLKSYLSSSAAPEKSPQATKKDRLYSAMERVEQRINKLAVKGGDSHVRQGDNVNQVTNNYYTSVDPSKKLDPFALDWG